MKNVKSQIIHQNNTQNISQNYCFKFLFTRFLLKCSLFLWQPIHRYSTHPFSILTRGNVFPFTLLRWMCCLKKHVSSDWFWTVWNHWCAFDYNIPMRSMSIGVKFLIIQKCNPFGKHLVHISARNIIKLSKRFCQMFTSVI